MLALLVAALAHAGVVVGGGTGLDVPLDGDTSSDTGPNVAAFVGWRQDLVLVHIQPELMLRYNVSNRAALVGPGFTATALSPVALGVFAHVGLPVNDGPTWDAGAVAELTILPKIRPQVRLGYHRARIGEDDDCRACAPPADDMLHIGLLVGVLL